MTRLFLLATPEDEKSFRWGIIGVEQERGWLVVPVFSG